jgi:hypothetical protein
LRSFRCIEPLIPLSLDLIGPRSGFIHPRAGIFDQLPLDSEDGIQSVDLCGNRASISLRPVPLPFDSPCFVPYLITGGLCLVGAILRLFKRDFQAFDVACQGRDSGRISARAVDRVLARVWRRQSL